MAAGPLGGVKVLEISIALTGPYVAALLADQGADVIKVERPGIGGIGRYVGVRINGMSSLFVVCNRGNTRSPSTCSPRPVSTSSAGYPNGYQFVDVTEAAHRWTPVCEIDVGYEGPAKFVSYTVTFSKSDPVAGVVVVDTRRGLAVAGVDERQRAHGCHAGRGVLRSIRPGRRRHVHPGGSHRPVDRGSSPHPRLRPYVPALKARARLARDADATLAEACGRGRPCSSSTPSCYRQHPECSRTRLLSTACQRKGRDWMDETVRNVTNTRL